LKKQKRPREFLGRIMAFCSLKERSLKRRTGARIFIGVPYYVWRERRPTRRPRSE